MHRSDIWPGRPLQIYIALRTKQGRRQFQIHKFPTKRRISWLLLGTHLILQFLQTSKLYFDRPLHATKCIVGTGTSECRNWLPTNIISGNDGFHGHNLITDLTMTLLILSQPKCEATCYLDSAWSATDKQYIILAFDGIPSHLVDIYSSDYSGLGEVSVFLSR